MEIILSSAKRGYGLNELLKDDSGEYWCTDDSLPHAVTVRFPKKTYVHSLTFFFSYSQDESYTPESIVVYFDDKARKQSFREPEGEKIVSIDAFVFEIFVVIMSNHSDGKDSHVRRMTVRSSPTEIIKHS